MDHDGRPNRLLGDGTSARNHVFLSLSLSFTHTHTRTHTHTPNNESITDPIKLICQVSFSQTLATNKIERERERLRECVCV